MLGAISLLRIRYVLAHPPSREAVAARFSAVVADGDDEDPGWPAPGDRS